MDGSKIAAVLCLSMMIGGCGPSKPRVVVAAKNTTEQLVLGEISAQHLERRLRRKVERRFNAGPTPVVFQELQGGDIGLYPDYTGLLERSILREPASADPSMVFERVRTELRRTANIETLRPLGIDNRYVIVVRAADAEHEKIESLTQAAHAKIDWRLGITVDFEQSPDGLARFNAYRIPLAAPARSMEPAELYQALRQQQLSMILGFATDSQLSNHEIKVLEDDKNVFAPHQACLLVRADLLAADPAIRSALDELTGKFTNQIIQKLNAQVDNDHCGVADVAAGFLASAGLK